MKINEIIVEGIGLGLAKMFNPELAQKMQSSLGTASQVKDLKAASDQQVKPAKSTGKSTLSNTLGYIKIPANKVLKVTRDTVRGPDVFVKYPSGKWFNQPTATSPFMQVSAADAENLNYALRSDFKKLELIANPNVQQPKQQRSKKRRGY